MSDLDLQQVLSSRYKTSLEADGYTDSFANTWLSIRVRRLRGLQ